MLPTATEVPRDHGGAHDWVGHGGVVSHGGGFAVDVHLASTQARFAARRAAAAVDWDADLDAWAAVRHAEVRQVLADWQTFSSARAASRASLRPSLITMDPPRHTALRSIVANAFTPRAVATMEPRIRAIADELLAKALARRSFDLVADFAHPLPVTVIAEMLGVPPSDRPLYRRWADAILGGPGARLLRGAPPTKEALSARGEMDAYFAEQCRRAPTDRDDLLGALLAGRVDGSPLEEGEILSFSSLLLLAGHITTVNLIANATWCLLEHPDARETLQRRPAGIPDAIEEVLRYMAPVQAMSRVATRTADIGDVTVREGDRVVAWIASANRDERVFEAPDRFDVGRKPNPHLAFGAGVHFCLGAWLTRLESRVALEQLLGPLRRLRASEADPPRVDESALLMGVSRLLLEAA